MLLHLSAGHAVSVQHGVQVGHHQCLDVVVARHPALVQALHGRGHAAEDPQPVARIDELAALEVGHLQPKGPHQVVIQKWRGRCWQVSRDQHGEWSAFASENVFCIVITVFIAGRNSVVVAVVSHRWNLLLGRILSELELLTQFSVFLFENSGDKTDTDTLCSRYSHPKITFSLVATGDVLIVKILGNF